MARQHSKDTVYFLGGVELTQHTNNSQLEFTGDIHDLTVYGKTAHVKAGGLADGTGSISGYYDTNASTGPRAVLKPMVMTNVDFIHRPEGTGSGKPQDKVNVVVKKYTQTHPIADYVTWAVDLEFSDAVDSTPQP